MSLFASGSEVSGIRCKRKFKGLFNIRVVNFCCWELFEMQSESRNEVYMILVLKFQ